MSSDLFLPFAHSSPTFNPDGWFGYRFVQADQAASIRGLEEIAALVAAGKMLPDAPVFYAYKRPDGGYPTVCIGVPADREEVLAMQRGDREAALDLLDALQEAYDGFMAQVKRGKLS